MPIFTEVVPLGHEGAPDGRKRMSQASILQEDGFAVIRIPLEDVHSLRVALAPCPCRAAKSTSTSTIRERLCKGLRQVGNPRGVTA